jgi:hypothetical protein
MRIQSDLRERVPVVTKKALENFEVLKSLV